MMYQGKGSSGKVKIKRENLPNISIPEGPNFTGEVINRGGNTPRGNAYGVLKNPQMRDKKKPRGTYGDVRGGGAPKAAVKKSTMWESMPEELRDKYSMKSMADKFAPANEETKVKNQLGSNKKQNRLLRRYMGGSDNGDS